MLNRYLARMAGASLLLSLIVAGTSRADAPSTPRTIGTHAGGIASTQFSPDGKLLASGGGDKMIRVWGVTDAKVKHEWNGPSSFTCAVRFSPDGKTLAAAGYESGPTNAIYLYDIATGKELPTLPGHPSGGVRRLLFAGNDRLVSGGFDGTVRIWDLKSRKELRQFKVEAGTVYSLALSPDGRTLATAGRDGLKLWDFATGKALLREALNGVTCFALAFSPDGKLVASGDGSRVTFWEVLTGKEVMVLPGFKGELSQILFTADGRSLITCSYDRTVRFFEVRTGRLVHEAEHHTGWVWGIALSPDEKQLASCSIDTKLLCHDISTLMGRPSGKVARLTDKQRSEHVANLASGDASVAFRAVCALAADPDSSLPVIQKRLETPSGEGPSSAAISRMIRDLDSDLYRVRSEASKNLADAGTRALPALQQALTRPPSAEVRIRAQRLLARLNPADLPAEELITLRGVQALEYMGTPQARKVLEKLARGEPGDRLTEEAAGALRRLRRTVTPGAAVSSSGGTASPGS